MSVSITFVAQDVNKKSKEASEIIEGGLAESSTERIIDKYGGKLVDKFNEAVEATTPVAEKGFKIAKAKYRIQGLIMVAPFFTAIFLLFLWSNESDKIVQNYSDEPSDDMDAKGDSDNLKERLYAKRYTTYEFKLPRLLRYGTPKLFLYTLGTAVLFYIGMETVHQGIMYLTVPEWYVIQDIINFVK